MAQLGVLNLALLEPGSLNIRFLPSMLPQGHRGRPEVPWDLHSPSEAWVACLWSWLQVSASSML